MKDLDHLDATFHICIRYKQLLGKITEPNSAEIYAEKSTRNLN